MSLAPGTRLGPYEILAQIGAGGMGEVYRATDTRLDRTVAIKVLPMSVASDPDRRHRFEREARTISSLNHPNICTLYDIGDHQGQPFIVMEVIKGETLGQHLARGAFKIDEILELGIQLADALDAAHAEGVIHRDIKPSNIFVTDRGQAKVVDFGLAKLAPHRRSGTDVGDKFEAATIQSEQFTDPGIALGTVDYMSPEQARGEELDSRTDLFSLGAVLYEMVTSHRAFPGQTNAVIFDAILNRTPVAPGRLNPAVPPKLQEIIHNALEKDRDLRYQNASDLRADLKRAKRGTDSDWSPDVNAVSAASRSAETRSPGGTVAAHPTAADPRWERFPVSEMSAAASAARGVVHGADTRLSAPIARRPAVYAALAVALGAVALVVLLAPWSSDQTGSEPGGQVRALTDALLRSQLALATNSLAASDYRGAIGYAEAVLAAAPDHAEALRIRDEARKVLDGLEAALDKAHALLDSGQSEQAAQALAAGLAIDPSHPRAAELASLLNGQFRSEAEEARTDMSRSRAAAQAAGAGAQEEFAQAERLVREAQAELEQEQFGLATQKFLEARDRFRRADRAAESLQPAITAEAGTAVVEGHQGAAQPGVAEQGVTEQVVTEPVLAEPAVADRDVAEPAVSEPVATDPVPTEDVTREPPPPPPVRIESPPVDEESAIQMVIAAYEQAIEGKDIELFRSVKPNLSAAEEAQLRDSFAAVRSQQVDIEIVSMDIEGTQALIRLHRLDTIEINGSQQISQSEQSINLNKSAGGWIIVEIGR